jgi:formylglycine-generating enzyme required for sulfatase activity
MAARLVLFLVLMTLSASLAHAERRVALLIGNSAYPDAPLENPHNDVALLQEKLTAAGFDKVELYLDLNVTQMSRRIEEFQAVAAGADIAVFFYSGHGLEVDGANYLVPVDAKLEYESDVKHQGIAVDDVVWALSGASKLQLILLDACRNNPFAQSLKRTRGAPSRGLAPVRVNGNMIVAYAAQPGHTAADSDPANLKNSPFSSALAKYLTAPNMEIRQALGWVRDYVLDATQHDQEPYQGGSIGKDLIYLGPRTDPEASLPTPKPADTDDAARADYDRVKIIGSAEAWEAFLRVHPSGLYAELAKGEKQKLAALEHSEPNRAPDAGPLLPKTPRDAPKPGKVALGAPPRIASNDPGGEIFKECEGCPEMVVIPAGRAVLGSRRGELGRDDRSEVEPHEVQISRPFAMGRYDVTVAEWKACVADGGCGSRTPGNRGFEGDRRPVIFVSWNDAQSFVDWLNANKPDRPYRLPSEAEWEYAARGCARQDCELKAFWFDAITPENAVYDRRFSYADSPKAYVPLQTEPVDWGAPNPFGLYNALGNVRQWTLDCWNPSPRPLADGAAVLTGDCSERVTRGGSWNEKPSKLRVAGRSWALADDRTAPNIGFRVVRELAPSIDVTGNVK